MSIRILIADDHVLFNDGLKSLIDGEPGLQVCGQVYCGAEVLPAIRTHRPDIILLDINLPRITGIELIAQIKSMAPSLRIVMISMYTDKRFVEDCRRQDVPGYILKNASKAELIDTIQRIAEGHIYYDPKLHQDKQHAGDDFLRKFTLTRRELEIVYLIKENHTSQQIADKLFLSVFTVETHRRNINLKLGIKNPADLIHFIYQNQL
jgi:DNA-binding NarL/FixJ family response regulator